MLFRPIARLAVILGKETHSTMLCDSVNSSAILTKAPRIMQTAAKVKKAKPVPNFMFFFASIHSIYCVLLPLDG